MLLLLFFSALVQPSLPIAQESMKEVPFSSLVLPVGTISSSLTTSTLSAGSVFSSVSSNKSELDEKGSHLADLQISSSENRAGKKHYSRMVPSSDVMPVLHCNRESVVTTVKCNS